jgi:SLIDE
VESDWDRIIKNIERGEARIVRKDEINRALKKKLERYKNPWLELKIQYGQNKGKLYNEECDRFMVRIYTCFMLSKLNEFSFSAHFVSPTIKHPSFLVQIFIVVVLFLDSICSSVQVSSLINKSQGYPNKPRRCQCFQKTQIKNDDDD